MLYKLALLVALLLLNSPSIGLAQTCKEYFEKSFNGVLKDLIGLRLKSPDGKYSFGLCVDAESTDQAASSGTGVLQLSPAVTVLGKTGQFYATAGTNWIELVYLGGAVATSGVNCSSSPQWSAHTLLICDEVAPQLTGAFRFVAEVAAPDGGCYALFELLHRRLCGLDRPGGLPAVAIALIVILALFCAYLILGAAIQRLLFNRRGLEMIPNYTIWRRCGDSMADGCDFVCRSGGGGGAGGSSDDQQQQHRRYQPVSDNHATGGLGDEDDENLLPA